MISDSLYANYISERQNGSVIENDDAFITYKINGDECFILDMYVKKEKRTAGIGKKIVGELEAIALSENCKFISANIHLFDRNANSTLLASLMTGFDVVRADVGIITIIKNLEIGA